MESEQQATVVIIGAGQAGLSAGYHLQRRGFTSALHDPEGERTFVMFDANSAPGGAWQHRWDSLLVANLNSIFDLPDLPQPPMTGQERSRDAIPQYFAQFEALHRLPIVRPVQVQQVRESDEAGSRSLTVTTSQGQWRARAIINATGTWNNPVLLVIEGVETFAGEQLHTRDYGQLPDLAGKRVAIVGGGISALQHLEEISRTATTAWYTRTPPKWRESAFNDEAGRDTIARVTADVEAGRPTGSVVSYTGLPRTNYAKAAEARGALQRRPMFTRIEPWGVREADGSFTSIDVIVWATGFKADLAHLAPLQLRNAAGGIAVKGTQVVGDDRLHLIGFGPSQSTVGANRAGKAAAASIVRYLR
ncbi:cation diffusion facilitator CzcD-associated flavoprotein CzcO [Leucobacter exalbidus]|uniref:Cation diffusion facilitator CzcD-associated flavoprotein CzcO n=1 Tax=Leucobacter exalbidus TaxID=662960 RepID=A0A940T527_9MICO|nr:cation diffusion facilitator CzcD-associated flavoprotein CzcO [Leucobacter exalbidus]